MSGHTHYHTHNIDHHYMFMFTFRVIMNGARHSDRHVQAPIFSSIVATVLHCAATRAGQTDTGSDTIGKNNTTTRG